MVTRALALLALAAVAACQDYRFSPMGRCILHTGRTSVSGTPSAVDVLFVVDDSLSMDAIQLSLANNLGTFINRLAQRQRERVAAGKEPFDFYIAVTSTSVLVNRDIASNGSCGRKTANTCSIDEVTTPPARASYSYPCTAGACGDIVTHYYNYIGGNCQPGVLRANGDPYPAGDFVAAGSNPTVLAFTRNLDWANPTTDATIQDLIAKFRKNVQVGSCGANQEMPLEAARRAIQKALAGQQRLPAGVAWPHPDSKIAVVIVSNEDDCSTRRADEGGLVWDSRQPVAQDSCHSDAQRATPLQLTPNDEYLSFLTGLGRPLVGAFVRPGFADCGGDGGPGTRMHALASALTSAGATAVEASVCGAFAGALERIADELAPPDRIQLPAPPVDAAVTRLMIQDADGATVRVCDGPGLAREWWFVDCGTNPPVALSDGRTSACIQLKPGAGCEPGPGQKLEAEFLGRAPSSGCADALECVSALGGQATEWRCEGASAAQKGTCVCARP